MSEIAALERHPCVLCFKPSFQALYIQVTFKDVPGGIHVLGHVCPACVYALKDPLEALGRVVHRLGDAEDDLGGDP